MIRELLIRGMLVGVLAGLLAFAFARTFGEPIVDRAISFEQSHEASAAGTEGAAGSAPRDSMPGMAAGSEPGHHNGDEELVSRTTQAGLGLFTGVMLYSIAFGGLFALAFGIAWGRVGGLGPRGLSALIAALGFVVVVVVPQLKYPANPPAVGAPDTIGHRTGLFFGMLLASLVAAGLAAWVRGRLIRRAGAWNATLAAGAVFVAVIAETMVLLPAVHEVPEGFPGAVLWQFRIASLGTEAVLWLTLGLVFGYLTHRRMACA
jgi:predicted cobalt transporter CbtA